MNLPNVCYSLGMIMKPATFWSIQVSLQHVLLPTLTLGNTLPISPAQTASSLSQRQSTRLEPHKTKGSTVVDTYPDVLKHFHSVLHKTVRGTLSCRETIRPVSVQALSTRSLQLCGKYSHSTQEATKSMKAGVQTEASSLLLLATTTDFFQGPAISLNLSCHRLKKAERGEEATRRQGRQMHQASTLQSCEN